MRGHTMIVNFVGFTVSLFRQTSLPLAVRLRSPSITSPVEMTKYSSFVSLAMVLESWPYRIWWRLCISSFQCLECVFVVRIILDFLSDCVGVVGAYFCVALEGCINYNARDLLCVIVGLFWLGAFLVRGAFLLPRIWRGQVQGLGATVERGVKGARQHLFPWKCGVLVLLCN